VALPCLLIAGWWYWRNYALYNDWLGTSQLVAINGLRTESVTWSSLWGELRGLRYSFWGLFGWFNILLPNWVYIFIRVHPRPIFSQKLYPNPTLALGHFVQHLADLLDDSSRRGTGASTLSWSDSL